jgi:hypothetical protein
MLFQSFGSHSNGTVPSDDDNRCRPRSDPKRLDEDGRCRPEKQNAKRCELAHGCGSPLSLTHFPYYSFALYSMWRRVEDNPSPFAHRYPQNLPRVTKILRRKIPNKNDMSIPYLFHHSGTAVIEFHSVCQSKQGGSAERAAACLCEPRSFSSRGAFPPPLPPPPFTTTAPGLPLRRLIVARVEGSTTTTTTTTTTR